MAVGFETKYRRVHEGSWRLWARSGAWSQDLWGEVLARVDRAGWSHHPQTYTFAVEEKDYYLKVYHRLSFPGLFKDLFRQSRAFRALKEGETLSGLNFHVPTGVAAGERRFTRLLERAFLLTVAVPGTSLPVFLKELSMLPSDRALVRKKRDCLMQLAREIRRMHEKGFVHGDLIPSNILVQAQGEKIVFYYLDHDRTRRYPSWLPQRLWKRNLVQLNRFVLAGISLQDRIRFLKCYLNGRRWGRRERQLALWLEAKTRKRRRECDQVEAPVSFRELMRWNGPFARTRSPAGREI